MDDFPKRALALLLAHPSTSLKTATANATCDRLLDVRKAYKYAINTPFWLGDPSPAKSSHQDRKCSSRRIDSNG